MCGGMGPAGRGRPGPVWLDEVGPFLGGIYSLPQPQRTVMKGEFKPVVFSPR